MTEPPRRSARLLGSAAPWPLSPTAVGAVVAEAAPVGVPHSAQNLAAPPRCAPQDEHTWLCGVPHSEQNLAAGASSAPQPVHAMSRTVEQIAACQDAHAEIGR